MVTRSTTADYLAALAADFDRRAARWSQEPPARPGGYRQGQATAWADAAQLVRELVEDEDDAK